MKLTSLFLVALLVSVLTISANAAAPSTKGRTITELKVIPTRVLQRSISPKFYKSLLISPVQGLVVVRGHLSGTKLSGLRVTKSDLGGAYDSYAMKMAGDVRVAGNYTVEDPNRAPSVLVHVLIYQIADGTMALSFAHFDEPGGDQLDYYGCARLAVQKSDGSWSEIKGPESLDGKGIAVKQSVRNNGTSLKIEGMPKGAEATNTSPGLTGR